MVRRRPPEADRGTRTLPRPRAHRLLVVRRGNRVLVVEVPAKTSNGAVVCAADGNPPSGEDRVLSGFFTRLRALRPRHLYRGHDRPRRCVAQERLRAEMDRVRIRLRFEDQGLSRRHARRWRSRRTVFIDTGGRRRWLPNGARCRDAVLLGGPTSLQAVIRPAWVADRIIGPGEIPTNSPFGEMAPPELVRGPIVFVLNAQEVQDTCMRVILADDPLPVNRAGDV